jgi:TRAP-type uncharacterized transport system fused permease subunit
MTDDLGVGTSKFRTLDGAPRALERGLLASVTLLGAAWAGQVQHYLPGAFFKEQYLGLFLGLAMAAVFVAVKPARGAAADRVAWYDWLLAVAGLATGLYVTIRYPTISYQLAVLSADKVLFGALAIALVLEATRRLVGWVMVGLVAWAAVIPALLYYLALFVQVDLEAAKHGLSGLPSERLPRVGDVVRRGWVLFIPLAVLTYTLMIAGWEAGKAGMAAVIATVIVGLLQPLDRLTWPKTTASANPSTFTSESDRPRLGAAQEVQR